MKYLILFVLTFSMFGCFIRDNPKVKVVNKSNLILDSVVVFAASNEKTIFKKIKINEKQHGKISFKNIPNVDGGYMVQVYYNGFLIKERGFGYYTNGGSLDYGFDIIIEKDTIIISSY